MFIETIGCIYKTLGGQSNEKIIRFPTKMGSYYNQDEWLEEFLDNKGAFHNGTGGNESDDSENDDKNYNESIEVVFRRCSSK